MANLSPKPGASGTGVNSPPIVELTICLPDDDIRERPSARTVALTTEDILREIFWCFDITSNSTHETGSRATLLHAASTCRAFMEPALDALWRSMSSTMPALKLLPNLRTVANPSNIFTFSNSFSESGWARFDYHAKRVREFRHHSALAPEMAMTALFHFCQYRRVIFPCLRKIVWTMPLAPSVMLLTSPTLNSLDITAIENDDPSIITTLLLVLGHSPRSVSEIALRGSVAETCLALVPKMTGLSTVIIPDLGASVSTTFLRQLGTLENLENLHISLERPGTGLLILPRQIGFSTLRTLRISGHFELIYNFVVAIMSERLVSISVSSGCSRKIPDPPQSPRPIKKGKKMKSMPPPPKSDSQPSDFSDLLVFITDRWPHLSRLDFDLPNMSPKYPDTTSYALLEPIHDCPLVRVESFSIRGFSRVPSSDQDLVDIGLGLPNARVLTIPFSPPPAINPAGGATIAYPQSVPTILGLRLLAELCPRLTSLQLSLDTRELPTLTGKPLTHGLQTLSVGDSPVGDAFLVAKHLDCLFPYLKKISGTNPIAHPIMSPNQWGQVPTMIMTNSVWNGWELVERILHNCQAARAEGRERIEMHKASRKSSTSTGRMSASS